MHVVPRQNSLPFMAEEAEFENMCWNASAMTGLTVIVLK
jgi:hypothetical protein